ncbi:unnamed protein product [Bursaphelenchus xylophilus]|uniref:(pine wood nematode) hypothetical protein n=1 Tax=Bursaphelenchus xylophilus TaxID=6326 RepID=A0A7I8WSP5_BURXY|nr:unnamed protein product [Bursaphelenchus xylophilus]CAG9115574.1 unnamed protein product [Bursaphelenchus xylophilus]
MADLNESFDSSASLEFPDLLIEDDERCHRRFMFTSRCNNDIKLYLLNHPKTNTPALFEIAEEGLNEVFQISSDDRSVIYGETVIKKGEFYMCSPLHPFFLLVSTLADKKPKELKLEELFVDNLLLVARLPSSLKALEIATIVSDEGGVKKYTYDHEYLITWLTKRFQIFVKAVKTNGQAPPMYLEYDSSLRYFTFQIFSDYLSEALTNEMRCVLEIEKPAIPTSTSTPATAKRKVDIPKAEKRPPPLSVKQRKLKEASKGVQSLTMFFNKAP